MPYSFGDTENSTCRQRGSDLGCRRNLRAGRRSAIEDDRQTVDVERRSRLATTTPNAYAYLTSTAVSEHTLPRAVTSSRATRHYDVTRPPH